MQLTQVTATGEQHGLINTLGNSVKEDGMKRFSEADRPKMEKLKKEECRMVKARYINHRGSHERLSKPYCRWAGEPIQMWRFIPGHEYEVPMGLVNEVNASGLNRRSKLDTENSSIGIVEGKDKIHEFVSASF